MNLYQLRFMGRRGPLADYIDLPNFVAIGSGGGGGSKFLIFNWLGLSPLAVALYYVPRSLWRRWRRRLLIRIYARCNDWQNSLQLRPYSFCIRHYCVMWRRKTCDDKHRLTLSEHIKSAEQRTIIQQYGDWYTGRWWVGCYIWCSEDGPAQSHPRCTKCTSPPINCHCTNFIILMWHLPVDWVAANRPSDDRTVQFIHPCCWILANAGGVWKLERAFPHFKFYEQGQGFPYLECSSHTRTRKWRLDVSTNWTCTAAAYNRQIDLPYNSAYTNVGLYKAPVCHAPALYRNGVTHHHTFFVRSPIIIIFPMY